MGHFSGGYVGKLARVNLTKGQVTEEPLDIGLVKDFIGGVGIAAKILFDEVLPAVAPFDVENKISMLT